MIKIILKENRKLLNEVTSEQAMATLASKATRKLIHQYLKQGKIKNFNNEKERNPGISDEELLKKIFINQSLEPSETIVAERMEELQKKIVNALPSDIRDQEVGQCIIWLKNIILRDYSSFVGFFHTRGTQQFSSPSDMLRWRGSADLENFFHWKRFIRPDKQDLNRVTDLDELKQIIDEARPLYNAWQEKQVYKDADAGTEFIGHKDGFDIYVAHNKGAACKLGKGTNWCTAAPGLDYFKKYYRPDNPLFIFIEKEDPSNKFQFLYQGEEDAQFMGKDNQPVDEETKLYLHNLLISFDSIIEKYPNVVNANMEEPQDV
jgi:hypothetical protein